jgi:hypothetical protein
MLSRSLRLEGVNCCLKRNYNYITSARYITPKCYWKGLYTCTELDCDLEYRTYIKDEPNGSDNINIKVLIHGDCKHEVIDMPMTLSGKKRFEQAKELLIKGVSNTRANNILFNRDCNAVKGRKLKNLKL